MALEIKGLRGDALKARSHIDALRRAYAKFNEGAAAHAADVEAIASQVGGMQSDLEFAANVLGNSANSSEDTEPDEKPFQKPGAGNGADHG